MFFESLAVPSDYRIRFDEYQRFFPIRPEPRQQTPKDPVRRTNLGTFHAPPENAKLMTKSQVLSLKANSCFEEWRNEAKESQKQSEHSYSRNDVEITAELKRGS
jgi:hypothetical protein